MEKKDKIADKKAEITVSSKQDEEIRLFSDVAQIIEKRKFNLISTANSQIVLMFWEIGKYINSIGQNSRPKNSLKARYRKLWQKQKNALHVENGSERQMYKSKSTIF